MPVLITYDQEGNPMPFLDLTGQSIDFATNVIPPEMTVKFFYRLIQNLVNVGMFTKQDLQNVLQGVDLAGYSWDVLPD